jgi:hypothetical protein
MSSIAELVALYAILVPLNKRALSQKKQKNREFHLITYVETKDEIFLKTIIPSRKFTKLYIGGRHEQV